MEHEKRDSPELLITTDSAQNRRRNRRREPRVDGRLNLTYSGMDAKQMLIETGVAIDLCKNGIGVCTERSLKPGMKLALFIECPDSEDYICIPEAQVEWVSENRFGLSVQAMKAEDRNRLQHIFSRTRRPTQTVS